MSEAIQEPSGNQPEASGQKVAEVENKDTVAYETHRKLLAEKKKLQAELEDFRKAQAEAQEAQEAQRGEYKKLWESTKTDLDKYKSELEQERQGRQNFVKVQNFLSKLDGKIDSKYLDFVPTDMIHLDPETGKVDAMSLDKAVEAFMNEHSVLVQKPNAVGTRDRAPSHAVPEKKLSDMSNVEIANSWGSMLKNLK
jgi:hypothetical protein